MLEVLANKKKGQGLVDFPLVGERLRHLEDEPAALHVLLVFPLWLDAVLEDLDGVYSAVVILQEVAEWLNAYDFCLWSSRRKKLEREAMGDWDQKWTKSASERRVVIRCTLPS